LRVTIRPCLADSIIPWFRAALFPKQIRQLRYVSGDLPRLIFVSNLAAERRPGSSSK